MATDKSKEAEKPPAKASPVSPPSKATASTSSASASRASTGSASAEPGKNFMFVYSMLKWIGLLSGFAATTLGLSSLVGALTENGYARAIGALFVTFGLPLAIADRLLPKDDPKRAKGIVTEVMAVTWIVFGLGFATLGNAGTRGLLTREGDRLQLSGVTQVARIAYFLAGVTPNFPASDAAPSSSGNASTSASTSASATASASTIASVMATTTASASAAPTASATAAPKSERPEKTPAELFKELAPTVVTIFVKTAAGDGGGTGFVIDKNGTIVTNHHVIDEAKNVKIKLFGGAEFTEIDLLADDAAVDLALLKIDPTKPSEGKAADLTVVALGDSEKIVVGERAISIGNPLGLEHTLTDGLVSARRLYEGRAWIQMSVPVSPGNSGGPVFNMVGDVIGITTAQLGGMFGRAQNLNLAVPVNELKKKIQADYPGRRKVGESAKGRW